MSVCYMTVGRGPLKDLFSQSLVAFRAQTSKARNSSRRKGTEALHVCCCLDGVRVSLCRSLY